MDCCVPGRSIPPHLLKFAQVHVHCIGDAIQPSHPLTSSSPSVLNLSQHRGLFQWVDCLCLLPIISFSISPSNEYSGLISFILTGLISLLSEGLSGVFSSTTVQRHQFFGILPSLWSSSYNNMWPLGRPWLWLYRPLSVISLLFSTLSRFVVALVPRSICLLISWLQSLSAVILEPKKNTAVMAAPSPPLLFAMQQWGQITWS